MRTFKINEDENPVQQILDRVQEESNWYWARRKVNIPIPEFVERKVEKGKPGWINLFLSELRP